MDKMLLDYNIQLKNFRVLMLEEQISKTGNSN